MVTIRIKDHTTTASTYADGQAIFALLHPSIERGEVVELSFDGFLAVPSAFINAAVIQLVEHVPPSAIRAKLRITDSTKAINEMIRTRMAFVESNKPADSVH
jgi:hypothetical protein